MATTKLQELETLFDDHPSLDASLQDFEHASSEIAPSPSPRVAYLSHHSGFRSDSDCDSRSPARSPTRSDSGGRFSPPAWRRDGDGNRSSGFWRSPRRYHSRDSSPGEYRSADGGEPDDDTLAAALRTRLPTGSLSPEKQGTPAPDGFGDDLDAVVGREGGVGENPNNCRYGEACVGLRC
jgi:hypothetical protein